MRIYSHTLFTMFWMMVLSFATSAIDNKEKQAPVELQAHEWPREVIHTLSEFLSSADRAQSCLLVDAPECRTIFFPNAKERDELLAAVSSLTNAVVLGVTAQEQPKIGDVNRFPDASACALPFYLWLALPSSSANGSRSTAIRVGFYYLASTGPVAVVQIMPDGGDEVVLQIPSTTLHDVEATVRRLDKTERLIDFGLLQRYENKQHE